MEEIWKDIPDYEGLYQVSNLGQVKSLNYNHTGKERILKTGLDKDGYVRLNLFNIKTKTERVHQLVAIAFLGHIPNGYETVVNHIDNNPLNNNIDNLELVSTRYNSSCHKTDVGVHWDKSRNKWKTQIQINGKVICLGRFTNKQDGLDMYQKALANIHLYNGDTKAFRLFLF